TGMAPKSNGEREQELNVASATSLAPNGDRCLATGQQNARWRERLAMARHLEREARHHLADLARLPLDAVAKDVRAQALILRHLGSSLERHLWRGDELVAVGCEAYVARLNAFPAGTGERRPNALGNFDAIAPQDVERVRTGRWIGHGGPGGDVHWLVARDVGD